MKSTSRNIAYSQEYQDHRREFDSVFESPGEFQKTISLGNGKFYVDVFRHTQRKIIQKYGEGNQAVVRLRVKDRENNLIVEIKVIDDHEFIDVIEHDNGREYFVYRIDLYGYSVMDILSGKSVDYIPESSFSGKDETFIWVDIRYCPVSNLLVADGCYWACPYGFEFYDFSNPMELPLPLYGDSYEIERSNNIEFTAEIENIDFTEAGECVLTVEGTSQKFVVDIKTQ